MITIINYGVGNVMAFRNVFTRLKIAHKIATCDDDLTGASKLILPGVGAFDWAMNRLTQSGMRKRLDELVLIKEVPVLGVCVGFQMMARTSEEGNVGGLEWLDADVKKIPLVKATKEYVLPHMGWNDANVTIEHPLFNQLSDPQFYFLHSYYLSAYGTTKTLAETSYGANFCCAAYFKNIFGVQFHPEKSHKWGEQLIKNFAELI